MTVVDPLRLLIVQRPLGVHRHEGGPQWRQVQQPERHRHVDAQLAHRLTGVRAEFGQRDSRAGSLDRTRHPERLQLGRGVATNSGEHLQGISADLWRIAMNAHGHALQAEGEAFY